VSSSRIACAGLLLWLSVKFYICFGVLFAYDGLIYVVIVYIYIFTGIALLLLLLSS
jgi:hypothetical protein